MIAVTDIAVGEGGGGGGGGEGDGSAAGDGDGAVVAVAVAVLVVVVVDWVKVIRCLFRLGSRRWWLVSEKKLGVVVRCVYRLNR